MRARDRVVKIGIVRKTDSTALERAVYASKSLVIGLALVKNRLTANEAAEAAQIEVRSQIEKWGEVEDCEFYCSSWTEGISG